MTNLVAILIWIVIIIAALNSNSEFIWVNGKKFGRLGRLIAFSVIAILVAIALKTMGWLGDIILRPFTWIF